MGTVHLHSPSVVGRAALTELDRVPWQGLHHAYGRGTVGPTLDKDVAASLRMLGSTNRDEVADATDALCSNIYHQGTIYEATAYAVPFVAALLAGDELSSSQVGLLASLLGYIAVASSYPTDDDVDEPARLALRTSRPHLSTLAAKRPLQTELVTALCGLDEPPGAEQVAQLETILDELEWDEDEVERPAATQVTAPRRVRHEKFGRGIVLDDRGDKLLVRFDDGHERLLARGFVTYVEGER